MSETEKPLPDNVTDAIVVLCTAPDEACAQQLASLALE
ncbi:divalent-cation tolerance protein CutA [Hafnia alvei]|uniref:Divalent-cation tolerance protein CutA n=1 Tax=Hafnia alvei TaxID=569 RepID=A0A377PEF0_HAFAL|nr:divalent-cation tolerance protein CutA [Hafnia alvei]